MNDKFKKILPHVAAIALFLGLTMIYFYPVITEDKALFQHDISNMAGWGKDLKDYNEQTGDYAFWSNSMFSGMPANYTFMAPFTNIFFTTSNIFSLKLSIFHLGVLFTLLFGFYIFLISIGCKPLLSLVGAIAYAFATYNIIIIAEGHVNKGLAMATMAPIIGGIILCYKKQFLWGSLITLIFTGTNVVYNHIQTSYYLLLVIIIVAIVYLIYAIKEKTLKDYFKSSFILLLIAGLAIAPNLGSLITTADYTKETMRGGAVLQHNADGSTPGTGLDIDYAFGWSYGKGETMTLLIPNFHGGGSLYDAGENSEIFKLYKNAGYSNQVAAQQSKSVPMFWSDKSYTRGSPYAGAIVCFLFLLGLIIVKGPEKWWLLSGTVLSFVLAWGRNFALVNNFLFYHLPLYSKFRTPEMALLIAEVTMAALAILALKEIFDNKENRKIYLKPIYISAGITGGLCLIFALFGGGLMSFSGIADASYPPEFLTALIADRKSMLMTDSWRSFIFIALAVGTLWYYINNKIKATYIIAIIGVLIFTDLWMVGKRFLNYDSFVAKNVETIQPTEVDRYILQDNDPNFRVLNLTTSVFQESTTSYFHKSIGGYSPAKLRRYQDIIDYYFTGGINPHIINMLNTKYVIVPNPNQQGQPVVQINRETLGNAWFVNELKWAYSPDEEIVALGTIDPAQTAVIDKEWQSALKGWESLQHEKDSVASIRLTNYANPGNIFYESSSTMPHLAVFSEVFYKTWRAYIDGVETPLARVNYILRGLPVPAGNHTIEFKCIDEVYLKAEKISKISSIVVGLVILSLLGFALWTTAKKENWLIQRNKKQA